MSADKLYTPDMLAAAVSLAGFPPLPDAEAHGEARSSTCGSTMTIDLGRDADGSIDTIGLKVSACAVGQASAAIFAHHARGLGLEELERTFAAMQSWLAGDGPAPGWPEIALIAPARDYPGRHGAMLLPWKAAIAALSSLHLSS